MSEIPFVNRLGDALEAAIATPAAAPRARRRRSRLRIVAVAGLLTVGASAAVAHVLNDPVELAANGVSCQDPDDPNVQAIVSAGDRTPIDACAQVLREEGRPVPPLVACDNGRGAVAVLPGRGPKACARAGFEPLPPGYGAARARVVALRRALLALDARSADCVPPRELLARVRTLLRRSQWTGWRASLRVDRSAGPCGSISSLEGDGTRSVAGALDPEARQVIVSGGPHRSTEELLHGRRGIAGPLMDASGTRCYTQAALRSDVRRRLARTGRSVAFRVSPPSPGVELAGARGVRLKAGCAVVTDLRPAADGLGIVVQIWQRG